MTSSTRREAIHKSKRQNSFGLSICSRIKYLYGKHGQGKGVGHGGGYNLLSAYTINCESIRGGAGTTCLPYYKDIEVKL